MRAIRTFLVALVLATTGLVGVSTPAEAATTGCRPVGGGSVSNGGSSNATVVVDTGSGAVWSACISFSGQISGVKALELAQATITDLDPVYEGYSGEGKAVCKLRGTGSNPPDCLSASVNYWASFLNGTYARGGAASTVLRDGDVQGWRYGTGTKPRAATSGTEATTVAPPATTPPTTAPRPTPTTAPAAGNGGSTGGGLSAGTTTPGTPGSPAQPSGDDPSASTTTAPADGSTTTTVADDAEVQGEVAEAASDDAIAEGSDDGSNEDAAALAATNAGSPGASSGSSSSPLPAIAGFSAVILAIVGAGIFVQRRRNAV